MNSINKSEIEFCHLFDINEKWENRKKKHKRNLCGVAAAGVGHWASESISDQLSETFFLRLMSLDPSVINCIIITPRWILTVMTGGNITAFICALLCLSYKPLNFDWYHISRKPADCQCLNFNYWGVDWYAHIYQSETRVSHYHWCDDVIKFRTSVGHITTTQLNCSDPLSAYSSQTRAIMTRKQHDGIIRLSFLGLCKFKQFNSFVGSIVNEKNVIN